MRVKLTAVPLSIPTSIVLTGLGCMAVAASNSLWGSVQGAAQADHPKTELLVVGELVAAFILFLAATRRRYPAWVRRTLSVFVIPLLLWAVFTGTQTARVVGSELLATAAPAAPPSYGSDDMYYDHYNAVLVLRGQNPYVGQRLAEAINFFRVPAYTPVARGRFADVRQSQPASVWNAVIRDYLAHPAHPPVEVDPRTEHSYPAGSFLVAVPAVWAGLRNIALPQLILFLLLGLAIVARAPPRWRLAVALLVVTAIDAAYQIGAADFDIWPLAFTIGAWLLYEERWASAVLLGAACATKQTAWLAVPFYLVWIARTYDVPEAARRAAIALGAFVLINLPWIIAAPGAWFASLWLPVSLPLPAGGDGLILLAMGGVVPWLPIWLYSLLEVGALGGTLLWYGRAYRRYPYAGLVLGVLPLVLAWRSTERYFALLTILAVAALALTLAHRARADQPVGGGATHRLAARAAAGGNAQV